MVPLHLLISSTCYIDFFNLLYSPKNIAFVQMANDVQLLPYSAQFIIQFSIVAYFVQVAQFTHIL